MRRPAPLLPLLAALLLAFPALAREPLPDYERWYAVTISGQPAGWMSTAQSTSGGLVTTTSAMALRVSRGSSTVSLTLEGAFTETAGGQPVSMTSTQTMGQTPVRSASQFKDGRLVTTTTMGERQTTSTRPVPPGPWLTPARAAAAGRQALREGAPSFTVRTIDPLASPDPIELTRRKVAKETIQVRGRPVEVFRAESTSSVAPTIVSTEYLDADGLPVRFSARLGEMELQFEQSTREAAQAPGPAKAPEIMVATFVRPDRVIERPREARRAVYLLSVAEGELPAITATGSQAVERLDARRARVTVDTARRRPADGADAKDLAATPMVDAKDPLVRGLAARATGGTDLERAHALRRIAHEHIQRKDLDAGFASASETVRSRQGDCTEHAVLLCAMLRARGIPARVVSGLVYADQFAGDRDVFAYHMWTQALVEVEGAKAWVDLDAALGGLPPEAPVPDATHIAIATSALGEGEEITAMGALAAVLGRLKITVEEVR